MEYNKIMDINRGGDEKEKEKKKKKRKRRRRRKREGRRK